MLFMLLIIAVCLLLIILKYSLIGGIFGVILVFCYSFFLDKKKPNRPKRNKQKEREYLIRWGLIEYDIELPHTEVVYYNGYPYIDKQGNFYNQSFYLWINNDNNLCLLNIDYNSDGVRYEIKYEDIESYSILINRTRTIINLWVDKELYSISLSDTAYEILLKNYPNKERKIS